MYEIKKRNAVYYLAINAVLVSVIFSACGTSKVVSIDKLRLMHDFCVPPLVATLDEEAVLSLDLDSLLNDTLLHRYLSKQDFIVANATGTLCAISNMLRFVTDTSLRSRVAYLEYRSYIQRKVQLMRITMDAFSAEIECEITRTREIAAYLTNLNKRGNNRLTAAAIAAGAVTTLAPVWVTGKSPQNITVVSGGIISVGLAVLALHPGGKKVKLIHERNLLSDVWFQNTNSTFYPQALWYILNDAKLSNIPQSSKIQIVKMRWLKFYLGNKVDRGAEELLFKNGGIYDVNNLELRASLLYELKSAIASINQNLEHFVSNISNLPSKGGW
jgi:hypothetical protein